jgi:hypothetical protein
MRAALALGLASLLVAGASAQRRNDPPADPAVALENAYQAYLRGDTGPIRSLRAVVPGLNRQAIDRMLVRWAASWQRSQALFLMEVVMTAPPALVLHLGPDPIMPPTEFKWHLLWAGQMFVTQRPAPFGSNPDEDAFEIAWHRLAMALLADPDASERYFANIERRVHADQNPGMLLSRALVSMDRCCRTVRGTGIREDIEDALRRLDRAAAFPETRLEGAVRAARLRLRIAQPAAALASLDAAAGGATSALLDGDRDLAFWFFALRGRTLDALSRFDEALGAYDRALTIAPGAQSAGVGRTATLVKSGRRDEASHLAAAVLTSPREPDDPWSRIDYGAARFVDRWLQTLRRLGR